MKKGVFVGRFCPLHLGHEKIIQQMKNDCGEEHCLLVIGSSNTSTSVRHFFSYDERKSFAAEVGFGGNLNVTSEPVL